MMFTGTTQQQDTRFSDKEKKLMKQMKFGDCLNKRVDMSKVKLDVLRPWISKKITDILHIEDDVVVEFVYNQLEEEKFPCPKKMQINMTGFLNGRNARQFMGELWSLLLSAQESESGIPTEFIQQKKDEILKRDEDQKNEQQGRYHDRSRSRDRDRDRRIIKERSSEKLSQREREQQLPPSTLTAIEQVRSQLSAKSRSASAENTDLFDCGQKKDVSEEHNNRTCGNEKTFGNRSNSPFARAGVVETSSEKIQNRSPRKSPQNRSQTSGATRNRGSSSRYCNSLRDRDRRRSSRSPKRRSPDRKHRRSRSRDRTDRRQPSNRRNSPSVSPFKTRTRSLDKRSNSRSPEKLRTSPRFGNSKIRNRKKSVSSNSNIDAVNGHESVHTKNDVMSSEDKTVLTSKRNKNRSQSRSLSMNSDSSSRKKKITKVVRSRSQSKKLREMPSSRRASRSLTHSSVDSTHKRKVRNSTSQNTSLSLSPEVHKDNFEIRKNKDSVQKKRHYRSNRDSSMSSADQDINKYQSDGRRREQFGRRYSLRMKTPRNEIGGRNQRSWSRRRSRSPRNQSWSRNRSRSPMRRSRSPRRYTRRRSPLQHFRGRGGTNRGRLNNWRRSPSPRCRGGPRFDRRYSPQQRRYSRERRSPLIQHNQFRKFSPIRRYSPHQQERRQPSSRDRRPLSPHRRTSRERCINFNRWDQTKKSDSKQKLQPRSSSESSNWDNAEFSRKSNECCDSIDIISPSKKNGRHEESICREQHQQENSPFIVHPQKCKNYGQTSIENVANFKASQDSNDKKDDVARKAKSEEKLMQIKKQDVIKNKEISQEKFSYSLSRTPSPFLKSHEREEICQKTISTIPFKKVQKSNASDKRSQKTTDTSSSENSGDSEDSDNEDNRVNKRKTSNDRKASEYAPKYENYSTSEDESNDESKLYKINSKGHEAKTGSNDTSKDLERDKDAILIKEDKRKLSGNVHKQSEILKKSKTISNIEVVTSSITTEKLKGRVQHKKYNFSDESDEKPESVSIKNKNKAALKRSLSASRLKKQALDSVESEDERVSKKKRKKLKKSSSKRNHSEYDDDESTSDSDNDHNIRRKKHKKHKKHSKKSKKHKKRKSKKSRKLGSASSSDKDDDNDDDNGNADIISNDNNYHKSLNIPANATMMVSGINEDLERQLRERALKSMKKVD